MIEPPPRARIAGSTACMPSTIPTTLTCKVSLQFGSRESVEGRDLPDTGVIDEDVHASKLRGGCADRALPIGFGSHRRL